MGTVLTSLTNEQNSTTHHNHGKRFDPSFVRLPDDAYDGRFRRKGSQCRCESSSKSTSDHPFTQHRLSILETEIQSSDTGLLLSGLGNIDRQSTFLPRHDRGLPEVDRMFGSQIFSILPTHEAGGCMTSTLLMNNNLHKTPRLRAQCPTLGMSQSVDDAAYDSDNRCRISDRWPSNRRPGVVLITNCSPGQTVNRMADTQAPIHQQISDDNYEQYAHPYLRPSRSIRSSKRPSSFQPDGRSAWVESQNRQRDEFSDAERQDGRDPLNSPNHQSMTSKRYVHFNQPRHLSESDPPQQYRVDYYHDNGDVFSALDRSSSRFAGTSVARVPAIHVHDEQDRNEPTRALCHCKSAQDRALMGGRNCPYHRNLRPYSLIDIPLTTSITFGGQPNRDYDSTANSSSSATIQDQKSSFQRVRSMYDRYVLPNPHKFAKQISKQQVAELAKTSESSSDNADNQSLTDESSPGIKVRPSRYKTITKSLSCYALKFLNIRDKSQSSTKNEGMVRCPTYNGPRHRPNPGCNRFSRSKTKDRNRRKRSTDGTALAANEPVRPDEPCRPCGTPSRREQSKPPLPNRLRALHQSFHVKTHNRSRYVVFADRQAVKHTGAPKLSTMSTSKLESQFSQLDLSSQGSFQCLGLCNAKSSTAFNFADEIGQLCYEHKEKIHYPEAAASGSSGMWDSKRWSHSTGSALCVRATTTTRGGGTNDLLRHLAAFLVLNLLGPQDQPVGLAKTSSPSTNSVHFKGLQPIDIVSWIKSIDRALLVQGWSEIAFMNPTHIVFLFMLLKGVIGLEHIGSERELHTVVMACLYLAYSYLGNEISYPLKPFLIAETNQLLVHNGIISRKYLESGENCLLNGYESSVRGKVIDQVRNRFWQYCMRIVDVHSKNMLRINAEPHYFNDLLMELKSYESVAFPTHAPLPNLSRTPK